MAIVYSAEASPPQTVKDQLDTYWVTYDGTITEPTMVVVNDPDDLKTRIDFGSTDHLIIYLAPGGESEAWRSNWEYKDNRVEVLIDIYTSTSRQQLYNLKQVIRDVIRMKKDDKTNNTYHFLRYISFIESNQEELNVWKGTIKVAFEQEGVAV
jgi:hypothetical protein